MNDDGGVEPEPIEAEVVSLDYAHERPMQGLGRSGKQVLVPVDGGVLGERCVESGMTREEAEAIGQQLDVVTRKLSWTPSWVSTLALVFLCVWPALILIVPIYFLTRWRVPVTFYVRSDLRQNRRRSRIIAFVLAGLSLIGSIAIVVLELPASDGGGLVGIGFLAFIILLIAGDWLGRLVRVGRVEGRWAWLKGFGDGFLAKADFDFERPPEPWWKFRVA